MRLFRCPINRGPGIWICREVWSERRRATRPAPLAVRILIGLKNCYGQMAKDPADYSTVDFIAPALHVTRGQVLMDRQRHIAIVAKRGRTCAHLVRVQSGVLKLSKLTARQLVEEWSDADYPFERAVAKLQELGRQHGITDAARLALEQLSKSGREPTQHRLFV